MDGVQLRVGEGGSWEKKKKKKKMSGEIIAQLMVLLAKNKNTYIHLKC